MLRGLALLCKGICNEVMANIIWYIQNIKLARVGFALDNKNGFERFWYIICVTIILEA
jgi:hypothetical protein